MFEVQINVKVEIEQANKTNDIRLQKNLMFLKFVGSFSYFIQWERVSGLLAMGVVCICYASRGVYRSWKRMNGKRLTNGFLCSHI